MGRNTLEFRPDIEGLRGIAVLLVLLAHAGVPGFSAGFVGVDIFFVISGYLITRLLKHELDAAGRLDLMAFYARRIKRLMPAMFVMLLMVATASQLLLPSPLQLQQATAGYWASLWSSNLYFAFSQLDYFDDSAQRNVFTHSWSLGVEEQFYLVWPLFLALLWWRRVGAAWWIAAVAVASFAFCLWLAAHDANAAYYLMPTRLWQLAVGAWVGVVSWRRAPWGWFGLVCGVLMVLLIGGGTAYPSPWALLPVACAALMLQADPRADRLLLRVVASQPLRYIGRISYSLYLWHWPLLACLSLLWPAHGWWPTAVAIAFSVVVATASERWVERPFRHAAWADRWVVIGGLSATLVLLAVMALWQSGVSAKVNARAGSAVHEAADPLADWVSLPEIYRQEGFDDYYLSDRFVPVVAVENGAGAGSKVVLAGDSILMQWEPAVSAISRQNGWHLVAATKSACPMLDASYVNGRIKRRFVECERWRESLVAYLKATTPDILIMGSASTYDFDDVTWETSTRNFLIRIQNSVGRIVILAPPPRMPFNPLHCVLAEGVVTQESIHVDGCSASLAKARQTRIAGLLVQATKGVANASVLSLDEIVCPDGECAAVRDGQVVFRDIHHLNAAFVAARSGDLAQLLAREGLQ